MVDVNEKLVPDASWDYYMQTHGPCPITTTGCVEALRDGRIEYDEHDNIVFRFDRLHDIGRNEVEVGYALLQLWLDSPRGGVDMGSRGGSDEYLQRDPIGSDAIEYAVIHFGLRTPTQLASWLGCPERYIRPAWIQQMVCDHMVRTGSSNAEIVAELQSLGFEGTNKNYVGQRRLRCSRADGVQYPSVPGARSEGVKHV